MEILSVPIVVLAVILILMWVDHRKPHQTMHI